MKTYKVYYPTSVTIQAPENATADRIMTIAAKKWMETGSEETMFDDPKIATIIEMED